MCLLRLPEIGIPESHRAGAVEHLVERVAEHARELLTARVPAKEPLGYILQFVVLVGFWEVLDCRVQVVLFDRTWRRIVEQVEQQLTRRVGHDVSVANLLVKVRILTRRVGYRWEAAWRT
ncbi:hypothetical protein CSO01_37290 [Cellulomonas soli]|uniref:Uncharacterized protein n=1 Tax=Cellulomonas soli TaxID=931535 RepID=A0A512PII7_9CELL|nr:hypothetical protein CSO01_37290 [Cellulomonas soli]